MRNENGAKIYRPDDVRKLAGDEQALHEALIGKWVTVYLSGAQYSAAGRTGFYVERAYLEEGGIVGLHGERGQPGFLERRLASPDEIARGLMIAVFDENPY